MRWVSYVGGDGGERVGLLDADEVRGMPPGTTLLGLLRKHGSTLTEPARIAREAPAEIRQVKDVELLSPIPVPPSVRDFMSFETHVVTSYAAIGAQVDPAWYEQPVFYFSNPAAVVGPDAEIAVSPGSLQFDFELEVAAVIGTPGSDISPERAEEHIAGYTVLCDWSARDLQFTEMKVGLGPAKGKDSATSVGPALVTLDEIEPYRVGSGYDLAMSVSVNGRPYSSGRWESLYWSFPQMIAFASRGTELRPGDVIGSGTVGTGCILELSRVHGSDAYPWLSPGDTVEIDVDHLGRQRAHIVAGRPVVPLLDRPTDSNSDAVSRLRT